MNEKLRDVLAAALQLPPERVTPELVQGHVPTWDSQGHLELIMSLEAAFGVEFELAEATALRSVGEIAAALRRHAVEL
jgi:acyl carrier protein